jgi:hypothetical protein
MRTLVGAAVFGLVPVPPMPDTHAVTRRDDWPAKTEEGFNTSERERLAVYEKLATKNQLAHIHNELENIMGSHPCPTPTGVRSIENVNAE